MTASFGYLGATSAVITRPESVIVSVTLKAGSTEVANAEVELWALPYASTWRKVATAVTDNSGGVHLSRTPKRRTTYQWRYLGDASHSASTSSNVTVKVHVKVTMHLEDSTIRAGQRVAAVGRVYPPKPGVSATLWLYGPGTRLKLASALIRSDGSYRITKALSHGPKSLYVTVPAASGNLGGESPHRYVNVN